MGSGGGADGRTFSSYKENSQRYIYFPKKQPRRIKYNVASLSNKKEGKEQYSSRVPLSESISFDDSKTKFKHKYIQGSHFCSRKVNSNTNITLD